MFTAIDVDPAEAFVAGTKHEHAGASRWPAVRQALIDAGLSMRTCSETPKPFLAS
jgi:hypothetical protein